MTQAQALQTETIEINAALTEDFCIGAWRVSPALNRVELSHGSLNRHLEPRLTKLLCYLAANEGQVVSRDELVKVLWPKVIVNENSLTRAVSELRKQLIVASDATDYIETIPKRGYRLLVPVEAATVTSFFPQSKSLFLPFSRPQRAGVAAMCLSLAASFWISQGINSSSAPVYEEPLLLADEIVTDTNYFGGEVSLSTSESEVLSSESIEAPIINEDKTHFAYIQYDHTGSTVFLGEIAEVMKEPIAVFNSNKKLFNLAWSPIGNSLLFAKQSTLTTAALFSNGVDNADLYSLDIDSFEVFKLVEQSAKPKLNEANNSLSLT
ncbi:MAG: hypothetical protein GKR91_20375 [Pseudomonadales bacterium]|nr:hypothetical protein [Pseudomonadales bacterium]